MGDSLYHEGHRRLQDLFDSRRLADRLEERAAGGVLQDAQREFIEAQSMFFLATADAAGRPTCSYKGGAPGFVRVLDPRTLAFPLYDGNGMFLSAGNMDVNPEVGLLFISFTTPRRIRVQGTARVDPADPLLASYPGSQMVVRVRIRDAFPNCPRYIHAMESGEISPHVPKAGYSPPVPDWKRSDWARDVLPGTGPEEGDPKPR